MNKFLISLTTIFLFMNNSYSYSYPSNQQIDVGYNQLHCNKEKGRECIKQGYIEEGYFVTPIIGGTSPINQCQECTWQNGLTVAHQNRGCKDAKPCCNKWKIISEEVIDGVPYNNYECVEWESHHENRKSSDKGKEECTKYEVVAKINGWTGRPERYVNECVEWKFYQDKTNYMITKEHLM